MFGLISSPASLGLFQDPNALDKEEALRMALLQAGLGIMSARTGGNLAAALGQGGMQGLQAYQGSLQEQKRDKAQSRQEARQAKQDEMAADQFGMQKSQFEAGQASAAEQLARQKAFEEAVKGAYIMDAQGNITGLDQNKYQAALAMKDPEAAAKMFYQQQQTDKSYFQPVYDASRGLGAFNARTGQTQWQGGAPITRPQDDPNLQRQLAAATSGGKVAGETQAQAAVDLPATESSASAIINAIDEVAQHPGRASATGASRMFGIQKLPGSKEYDFDAKVANLQGKVFKEAFQSMKGAGAITEQEGKAAERAIANLDSSQSEEQFMRALTDLKAEISRLRENARIKSGKSSPDAMLDLQLQGMPQTTQGGGWGIREIK